MTLEHLHFAKLVFVLAHLGNEPLVVLDLPLEGGDLVLGLADLLRNDRHACIAVGSISLLARFGGHFLGLIDIALTDLLVGRAR